MARFDIYPNLGAHGASTPYLLDIQNSLFDGLDSRVIIPLRLMDHFAGVKLPTRLTPILQVSGKEYLLETPKMGAVPRRVLKDAVMSLVDQQDQITAALDFLSHGY